jgi:hypothetical protein
MRQRKRACRICQVVCSQLLCVGRKSRPIEMPRQSQLPSRCPARSLIRSLSKNPARAMPSVATQPLTVTPLESDTTGRCKYGCPAEPTWSVGRPVGSRRLRWPDCPSPSAVRVLYFLQFDPLGDWPLDDCQVQWLSENAVGVRRTWFLGLHPLTLRLGGLAPCGTVVREPNGDRWFPKKVLCYVVFSVRARAADSARGGV